MALLDYAEDGIFAPARISTVLRTTQDEVARTAGLGRDAVQRADRLRSPRTQRRLREMIEILNKTEPRFGSALVAMPGTAPSRWPDFPGGPRCSSSARAARRTCSTISTRWTRACTPDRQAPCRRPSPFAGRSIAP